MNKLNRLDMVRLLDAEARRSPSVTPQRFLFFACNADRALFVLSELGDLGWSVSRPRREAKLNGCVVHVLTADEAATRARGCRIAGYLADEDVALDLDQRLALMPAMLGNQPAEAAANE